MNMIGKRFLKGILAMIVVSVLSTLAISLFSCQNEEIANSNVRQKNAKTFMNNSTNLLADFLQADVVVHNGAIQCAPLLPDTTSWTMDGNTKYERTTTVYVIFPEGTSPEVKNLYNEIMSVRDMASLERMTAADFSTITPPDSAYAFQMSEDKVSEELKPMTDASIQYLMTLGVSYKELMDMIEELKTDTTSLIPLALVIAEYQMNEETDEWYPLTSYNPMSIFVTTAHATSKDNMDWSASGLCAFKAVGGHIIYDMFSKNFTKGLAIAGMKKIMVKILARTMGIIGVAITIAEFVSCMRESGKCVFETKSPTNFEGKLLDAINKGNIGGIPTLKP